jgi:hypothetical protein
MGWKTNILDGIQQMLRMMAIKCRNYPTLSECIIGLFVKQNKLNRDFIPLSFALVKR